MIVLSWNVRGLGSRQKRSLIKGSIRRKQPDVLCLQETKVPKFSKQLLDSLWGDQDADFVSLDASGSSGGILIAWKSSKWDLPTLSGAFSKAALLQDKYSSFRCIVISVYGPTDDSLRPNFWEELNVIRQSFTGPCCFVGDFNVIRFPHKHSRRRRSSSTMHYFNDWIQAQELVDLPLFGAKFTWSNGRRSQIQFRLDRFLVSLEWIEEFPSLSQTTLPRTTSDHCPILLLVIDDDWGLKPFKFNPAWLRIDGFHQKIVEWWSSFPSESFAGYSFMNKFCLLKENLKVWKKEVLRKRETEMETLFEELNLIDSGLEGNDPSLEMLTRRIQIIQSISSRCLEMNSLGKSNRVPNGFQREIRTPRWSRPHLDAIHFRSLLSSEAERLEIPFTVDEVKSTIHSMGGEKSSGPDGFPMSFFHVFWDTVHPDIMNFLNEFHARGKLSKGIGASFIALIPKVPGASSFSDFRPISLIGSPYKILAKLFIFTPRFCDG
ncbi:uncharacterized protein LOC131248452 [Magnolia sinica]|uniref:uncharacterized protein LOC131248452 n=1 Tax=Magnolia sinica TaxID=86752 RepID=UPI0026589993|nr:uncharacterized protein LOC131248452 [Magnolia sinica]